MSNAHGYIHVYLSWGGSPFIVTLATSIDFKFECFKHAMAWAAAQKPQHLQAVHVWVHACITKYENSIPPDMHFVWSFIGSLWLFSLKKKHCSIVSISLIKGQTHVGGDVASKVFIPRQCPVDIPDPNGSELGASDG